MRFPRPENTIESWEDLMIGEEVWEVYGILCPFVSGPYIVSRAPMVHSDHPEYEDIHSGQKDLMVFNARYVGSNGHDYDTFKFASDCNMEPGKSHNDNYLCRSKEDAEKAVEFLTKCWNDNPGAKAEEYARREEDRLFYTEMADMAGHDDEREYDL